MTKGALARWWVDVLGRGVCLLSLVDTHSRGWITAPRWSESALDRGFYDQTHLNRETRALVENLTSKMLKPPANPIAQGFRQLGRKTSLVTTLFRYRAC
ncbi:MAG: hypothetical protein ABJA77_11580 [Variovorax sp.]